jgi:hypothetical protein
VTGGTSVEDRPEFRLALKAIEDRLRDEYERRFEVCNAHSRFVVISILTGT